MRRIILAASLFAGVAWATPYQMQAAVGTSAVEVGEHSSDGRVSITIKAHRANTGIVYCAMRSSVTTTDGFELAAGDGYTWDTAGSTIQKIWCVGSAASQRVSVDEATK